MHNLKTRLEKIETTLHATTARDDWFEIIKENGLERGQEILAERGMTAELETLREMLVEAHAFVEQWERETFGEFRDA